MCRKSRKSEKGRAMEDKEMIAIEAEYELMSGLAKERWSLQAKLDEIDRLAKKNSFYWYIGPDGLVEIGLGIYYGV